MPRVRAARPGLTGCSWLTGLDRLDGRSRGNTDAINRLFLADRKFKFVLGEPEKNIRYGERRWKRFVEQQAADGALRVHWPTFMHPFKLDPSAVWYWERGALFDCTDKWYWGRAEDELFDYPDEVPGEVMYLDLRQWKRDSTVTCDFGYDDDPGSFHITYTGISTGQATVEGSRGNDVAHPA